MSQHTWNEGDIDQVKKNIIKHISDELLTLKDVNKLNSYYKGYGPGGGLYGKGNFGKSDTPLI